MLDYLHLFHIVPIPITSLQKVEVTSSLEQCTNPTPISMLRLLIHLQSLMLICHLDGLDIAMASI